MITQHVIQSAVERLASHSRGQNAMRHLLTLLDDGGIGLDAPSQRALLNLLQAAFEKPGSTRDAMRDFLETVCSGETR